MTDEAQRVTVERRGHVLLLGLNRADKANAFDQAMVDQLGAAYTVLETEDALRCGVLFAHGPHFTAGLNLAYFAEHWEKGENPFAPSEGQVDPWGLVGRPRRKPVVCAVHGRCYTLGIELLLAADVRIGAEGTRFAQLEVQRGIYPVGGATLRFAQEVGWGNAMRWLLTGDEYDAAEALRIGLVQEVVPPGKQLDRALAIAERISVAAPAGVRAIRDSARQALEEGYQAALGRMLPHLTHILRTTQDSQEGVLSFIERRAAVFTGL
jgi:enoyl-CoA hydratase